MNTERRILSLLQRIKDDSYVNDRSIVIFDKTAGICDNFHAYVMQSIHVYDDMCLTGENNPSKIFKLFSKLKKEFNSVYKYYSDDDLYPIYGGCKSFHAHIDKWDDRQTHGKHRYYYLTELMEFIEKRADYKDLPWYRQLFVILKGDEP